MVDRDHIDFWGVNMRLQPFQAIVAEIELQKVNKIVAQRQKNAKILDKLLSQIKEVKIPERKNSYKETISRNVWKSDEDIKK